MIIKLHTSQKVTAGLHGGREENERVGCGVEGGGTREAGGKEKKGKDKRIRMRVWERWLGLKEKWGRTAAKLNIAECIKKDDWTPDRTEMSSDEEAELPAAELGQIICIVAGG